MGDRVNSKYNFIFMSKEKNWFSSPKMKDLDENSWALEKKISRFPFRNFEKIPVREREDKIVREIGKTGNPVSGNAMPNYWFSKRKVTE